MGRHLADDWQQTDQIIIAVQTAEMRQPSLNAQSILSLSCSLVNIARGQCLLDVHSGEAIADIGLGELVIEIGRPIMRGEVTIPETLYGRLMSCLVSTPPRPISFCLKIGAKLAVSVEGDLRIDEETKVAIVDIGTTLPLK